MSKKRKPLARAHWAKVVEKWKASGESGYAYADRQGIPASTLYWWNRELKKSAASSASRRKKTTFSEVVIKSAPQITGSVEIVSRNGLVVRVNGEVGVAHLRSVLAAVQSC